MKNFFNVLSWCYVIFALLLCLGTGSLGASIVLICSAFLTLPIKFIRKSWIDIFKKHTIWIKPIAIFIVFWIAISLTPNSQAENIEKESYINNDSQVSLESEKTESVTKAPETKKAEPVTEAPETEKPKPVTEAPETEKPKPVTEAPETERVDPVVKEETQKGITYTLNTNSKKFHYPSCSSAKKIKAENISAYTGQRSDLISRGYSPCGNCHP